MRVSHRFVSHLDHLGSTVPVRTLDEDRARREVVALRHDVDHDLDAALELAYGERERGCRASYFRPDASRSTIAVYAAKDHALRELMIEGGSLERLRSSDTRRRAGNSTAG